MLLQELLVALDERLWLALYSVHKISSRVLGLGELQGWFSAALYIGCIKPPAGVCLLSSGWLGDHGTMCISSRALFSGLLTATDSSCRLFSGLLTISGSRCRLFSYLLTASGGSS